LFFSWPLPVFLEFLEFMLFLSSANSLCKALYFASTILPASRCIISQSCFWVAGTSASRTIAASAVTLAFSDSFAFFLRARQSSLSLACLAYKLKLVEKTWTSAHRIISLVAAVACKSGGILFTVRNNVVKSSRVADKMCCSIAFPPVCNIAKAISGANCGFLPRASKWSSVIAKIDAQSSLCIISRTDSRSRTIFLMICSLSCNWNVVTRAFVSVTRAVYSVDSSASFQGIGCNITY
jgi:hypothetical protein